MTEIQDPEWLQVGMPVAVVRYGNSQHVRLAIVERLTKTRVVLEGGEWFNRERLSKSVGGTWGSTLVLKDADDPQVVRGLLIQQSTDLAAKLEYSARWLKPDTTPQDLAVMVSLAKRLVRKLEALYAEASR